MATASEKLAIIKVVLDDQASDGMKELGNTTEQTEKKTAGLATGFFKAQIAMDILRGALDLGKKALSGIWDTLGQGAELARLEKTSKRMAINMGVSNEEFDEMVDNLAKTNTFGINAVSTVETFIRSGLLPMASSLKRVTKELDVNGNEVEKVVTGMDAFVLTAKDFGAAAGVSSGDAIRMLTTSIKRMSPEMLEMLGIQINLTEEYKKYAKQIGLTGETLSEAQKQEAMMQAIMREGTKVVGSYEEAYTSFEKVSLSMHDATLSLRQELGQGFEPVLFEVGNALLSLIKVGRDIGVVFGDTMQGRSQEITDAFGRLWESVNKLLEAFGLAEIDTKALGTSLGNLAVDSLVSVIDGITSLTKEITQLKGGWDDFNNNALAPFIDSVKSFLLPVLKIVEEEWNKLVAQLGEMGIKVDFAKIAVGLLADAIIVIAAQVAILTAGLAALLTVANTVTEAFKKLKEWLRYDEKDGAFLNWVKDLVSWFTVLATPIDTAKRAIDKFKSAINEIKDTEAFKILKGTFSYTGKQSGGLVLNSGFHKINEAGQEMAYLPRGTKVLNARRTEEMQGGQTINIVNNMNTQLDEQLLVDRLTYQLRLI